MKRPTLTPGFAASLALASGLAGAGAAHAENVEIYLLDMLDNTQAGYCFDIAGGREAEADPADGLQGHTCYSPGGALGIDQTFDSEKFSDGLLYMTEFDVCAEITAPEAGAALALNSCDGSDAQSFLFSGEGRVTPASAPDLCVTLGEATRSGRSDANQIKAMTLETCDSARAAYQTWGIRTAN
ncbi:Ricin-type beta-trefoil lectin domain protein [Pseudoruegeria aquimaris]|uniref:Ricin-type beta-trefoil lectin domain protein n=1 Tax=Pseudoruegeria aquimaris TaxID=393663 RepID=A0A1Y5T4W0_9RHOB|nr:RICIN domain-containing protein [Pseudoruegeria aquimaris]SLN55849.1 Ricin-type beta-trefoil lectin domain protein [Pseudoruegeria aquimaris]